MGVRPSSLLPGTRLVPIDVAHKGHPITLGIADPGRRQMLLFERGHWCASCRRHLALIAESSDEFVGRGYDIVAITHEDDVSLAGRPYPFPLIADPELDLAAEFDLIGIDEFGTRTIRPATVVVDENNIVAFSYVGEDSRDRPTVAALLLAFDNLN